jgi:hypothetical protein
MLNMMFCRLLQDTAMIAARHGNDHSKQNHGFATCLVRVWNPRGMKVYEHKKTGSF